jgi:hypothetical protein
VGQVVVSLPSMRPLVQTPVQQKKEKKQKTNKKGRAPVAHAWNPSDSWGRDEEEYS